MVEFALVLPVLLLLVLGLIEFGRLLFIYSSVATASREAARYGSAAGDNPGGTPRYMDCAGMREAAKRLGSLAGIQDADIIIQYDHGPSTAVFNNCPVASADDIAGSDRVVVNVSTNYTPFGALVNLPSFTISSASARTIVKGIQLSGALASSATPGSTSLPTSTSTSIATVTATATNLVVPTATNTSPAISTATATTLPTLTSTTAPNPGAPVFVQVSWNKDGTKCKEITFTWGANASWSGYPAADPVHYQVYRNGSSLGTVEAKDPDNSVWESKTNLNNNGTVALASQAIFSGGLGSELLTRSYLCDKGNLVEQ